MHYLVFDTETTGLPINNYAPLSDLNNWPRLVQLAWSLHDATGREIKSKDALIKPDGYKIPYEATKIHGITNEMVEKSGEPIIEVLSAFVGHLKNNDTILVAHNLEFDDKIVGSELVRYKILNNFLTAPRLCTMRLSTVFCALPNRKPPRLTELYQKLFNENFSGAHRADADTRACARCFFELKKLGVIKDPELPSQRSLF